MSNKTVLATLIEELKEFSKLPMVDNGTAMAMIDFAKMKLNDEKKQIVEAYSKGSEDMYSFTTGGEKYFNETFKND